MSEPRSIAVRRKLRASREAVDAFCAELRAGLLAGLPARERFATELLLREALMNAVAHGAKPAKTPEIRCQVRLVAGGVEIRVHDNGRGFDWRNLPKVEPPVFQESGRGLLILHRYASQVRFSAKGNQVEMTRMFCEGNNNEPSDEP